MRTIALSVAILAATLSASSIAQSNRGQALTNVDQRPAPGAFSEDIFGVHIEDPYRWMENPDRTSEWQSWARSSSAHTQAQLASLPGRARVAERLQRLSRASTVYFDLAQAGGRLFYLRTDPDATAAKLVVREPDGTERVLVDPMSTTGSVAAINNYAPSPSGRRIAFQISEGGGEVGVTRFMDVATRLLFRDQLSPIWGEEGVSWLDDTAVLYTRMDPNSPDPLQNMTTRIHEVGGPVDADVTLLSPGHGVDSPEFPSAFHSPIGRWTIAVAAGARADVRVLYSSNRAIYARQPRWTELATYDDHVSFVDVRGDYAYLLTTRGAPNGKIVRVLLSRQTFANADVVVPETDIVLTGLSATRDGLYVSAMHDGVSRLLFLPNATGAPRDVALPFEGTLANLTSNGDASAVTFQLSGWLQNTRYFIASGGAAAPLGVQSETYGGVSNFEEINEQAVSADGTHVPLFILAHRGVSRDGGNPTILYGYGSYGVSQTPFYSPNVFAWLEEGGVYTVCAVRGGGERGRAWLEGGRERNKPNAQADFIACGERLVQLGYTRPGRLGAFAVSAGGLLAPAAALRRPDLFRAVAQRVGMLNVTRLGAAENGPNQFAEMGDPSTSGGFHALYEADAYQWLARAHESPDWFLTIGLNDRRVAPWMSAKFAARALARFGDHHLVLIRSDGDAGHGIGSTRDQVIEERADIYAFFLNRFGASDFQVAAPAAR